MIRGENWSYASNIYVTISKNIDEIRSKLKNFDISGIKTEPF